MHVEDYGIAGGYHAYGVAGDRRDGIRDRWAIAPITPQGALSTSVSPCSSENADGSTSSTPGVLVAARMFFACLSRMFPKRRLRDRLGGQRCVGLKDRRSNGLDEFVASRPGAGGRARVAPKPRRLPRLRHGEDAPGRRRDRRAWPSSMPLRRACISVDPSTCATMPRISAAISAMNRHYSPRPASVQQYSPPRSIWSTIATTSVSIGLPPRFARSSDSLSLEPGARAALDQRLPCRAPPGIRRGLGPRGRSPPRGAISLLDFIGAPRGDDRTPYPRQSHASAALSYTSRPSFSMLSTIAMIVASDGLPFVVSVMRALEPVT